MMHAYCGLKCDECNAYIAKRNDNDQLRVETAIKWGKPDYPIDPSDINCDGCKIEDGVLFKFCSECLVRECARQRGIDICENCSEYKCDTFNEWENS